MKSLAARNGDWRVHVLDALLLALLGGIMSLGPIAQSAAYHDFADQRFLLGVPNLLDVASSVAFVAVGAMGVTLCAGPGRPPSAASWIAVFFGTLLTGFGSAFYHWAPSDASLVWDRLPMALGFTALLTALVVEHLGEGLERFLLAPALAVGVSSVLWWQWSGDLRLYLFAQYAPMLCIPFILALFPARYSHRRFVLYALGFYGLAKAAEAKDAAIFELTGQVLSGHTLKHLLAAWGIFMLLVMLRRREACAGR